MVILRDVVATLPLLEVAVTTKGYVPATGFTPDITPDEESDNPETPIAPVGDQVTGGLQLLVDNV